jgi:hypothetical protein
VTLTSRHGQAVEEGPWLTEKCGYLKLKVLLSVEIVAKILMDRAEGRIQTLHLIIEHKVLLFDETQLHQGRLITRLKGGVRLN